MKRFAPVVFSIVLLGAAPGPTPPRGFYEDSVEAQRKVEREFLALPDPNVARESMRRLAAAPHHLGSAQGAKNAEWILGKLKEFGLDAKIETFDVLFPTPKERLVEMIEPSTLRLSLAETPLQEDPTSGQTSEQLPTFIRLAVAKHYRSGESGGSWAWRAGGLLVQKLTREGGHGSEREAFEEEDWVRAQTLAETVEDHELLDPLLPAERLLYRLFHEEQVRVYRAIPLETYCSCSRERVEELLHRFSPEDLADMVIDGEVWVTCEFCNARYNFDPSDFGVE